MIYENQNAREALRLPHLNFWKPGFYLRIQFVAKAYSDGFCSSLNPLQIFKIKHKQYKFIVNTWFDSVLSPEYDGGLSFVQFCLERKAPNQSYEL